MTEFDCCLFNVLIVLFNKKCMQLFKCNSYDYALMKQGESSTKVKKWICRNLLLLLLFCFIIFIAKQQRLYSFLVKNDKT